MVEHKPPTATPTTRSVIFSSISPFVTSGTSGFAILEESDAHRGRKRRASRKRIAATIENEEPMQITPADVAATTAMITEQNLDIRTITLGLNLRSCAADRRRRHLAQDLRPHDLGRREPGAHRRATRARVRHPHCQQAHLGHSHRRAVRRRSRNRPVAHRRGHGQGRARRWASTSSAASRRFVHKGATRADDKLMDSIPDGAGRHRVSSARR